MRGRLFEGGVYYRVINIFVVKYGVFFEGGVTHCVTTDLQSQN